MSEPWGTPASTAPTVDVLGPPAPRGRLRGAVLGSLAAVAVAGVAGTAWAAAAFLSGGGPQPEDVLPAGTVAMAKVDLDPAASQKLAVFRLAQRFPSTSDDVSSADDVRDELLRSLFEDNPDVDYARDVEPWVGDRAAIAAVPVPGEVPQPLGAVAFTDREQAQAALGRIAGGRPGTYWAFSDNADFVLIGTSQATVDAAAATTEVLAGTERYGDDVDALDGDQVVTAWADLDALWSALPDELQEQALASQQLQPTGRVVVGGRATDDGVEVLGRSFGLSTGNAQGALLGSGPGTGMVADLPADTVAAAGVTGLGASLGQLYDDLVATGDPLGVAQMGQSTGLDLPDDLAAVFGDETVVAAFGPDDVAARSRTGDPDRARTVVETLVASFLGFGQSFEEDLSELPAEQLRRLDDGIAVGTTGSAVDRISGGDGGLGRSEVFQRAVPDHEQAGLVLFVDVARALEAAGPDAGDADLEALEAVGLTAVGGGDGTFRLRLTVR